MLREMVNRIIWPAYTGTSVIQQNNLFLVFFFCYKNEQILMPPFTEGPLFPSSSFFGISLDFLYFWGFFFCNKTAQIKHIQGYWESRASLA